MKNDMETLLKTTLKPSSFPASDLNDQIMKQAKEIRMMKEKRKKTVWAAALTAGIIGMSGISVYAAYRYLSPSQIAEHVSENKDLSKAFESDDAILVNETQVSNGYQITLLGLTSGDSLSNYIDEENAVNLEAVHTYVAFAIVKEDGTPMEEENKCLSPLINGVSSQVANNATLDALLQWFYQDGVLYELLECDNLEVFANMGVQIGVVDSFGKESVAFTMDDDTGVYSKNRDYDKTNALFTLPLESSKGDNEKAAKQIEAMKQSLEGDESGSEEEADFDLLYQEIETFVASLTDETLDDYAKPIESTRMICVPDAEGVFDYSFELPSGAATNGTDVISTLFPDKTTGVRKIGSYSYSGGLSDLLIDTFILNEDGTVTYEVYTPIVQE